MARTGHAVTFGLLGTGVLIVWATHSIGETGRDRLSAAVDALANGPSRLQAKSVLESLPPEDTVRALVDALATHPGYQEAETRYLAYHVLYNLSAARIPEGFDQIIRGLKDSAGQTECARALLLTPPERLDFAVAALGHLLDDPDAQAQATTTALKTLARFGTRASPVLGRVEALYAHQEIAEQIRTSAAVAVLQIAGLDRAMTQFRNVDPVGQRAALTALGGFPFREKTHEVFGANPVLKAEIRQMVLNGLTHEAARTRETAFEAAGGVWGDDLVVACPQGRRFDRELEPILLEMARSDPDQKLREKVSAALRSLDDQPGAEEAPEPRGRSAEGR